jgi:uncharacterized protein YegP (UPF0339 family)
MVILSYPSYYAFRDPSKQWRWTYYASNGRVIAVSSESYHNKSDCLNAIKIMQSSSVSSIYTDE